ncbi:hypothetical protein DRO21_06595, partial [archaeon]
MVSYKTILLLGILTTTALLLILPISAVVYDDFQNHPDNNVSKPEERFGMVWNSGSSGSDSTVSIIEESSDIGRMKVQIKSCYNQEVWIRQKDPATKSDYWAIHIRRDAILEYVYLKLYNKSGNCIVNQYIRDYLPQDTWVTLELVISGTNLLGYVNGEYKFTKSCPEIPSYIGFSCRETGYYECSSTYIDDVIVGLGAIIETIPHNWYVLRHWDSPEASGVYDADGSNRGSELLIRVLNPYFVDKCDEFQIKYFESGEVIKVENITEKGFHSFSYNISNLLFHENPENDKYGIYLVELMRGGDVVARDYFFFTWNALNKPSGTIAWDKDSYASGSIAKVHANLTDPDFTTYVYKGYVYDVYGNKKEEWTITNADEWHEVDLNGYDAGVYYAILKIRNKDSGFEWEEAWDVASVSEEVRIEGVSYDAKSETVLGGVYVNAIQNYEDHETITDATTGEYNISKLSVDMEIQMNASKTNYTHNNFSFTPLQNGLYEINLYLLPDASHINVTAPAIVGLTQLYPFHQNVSYATVNIWNDTWNASTTTNSMGYFAFENLSPGT